jgi:hypothetical protein
MRQPRLKFAFNSDLRPYNGKTAVLASAAQDALNRKYLAPVGEWVAAGAGASGLVYSLWRDPSIGPYLVQTWGYLEGMLNPAGTMGK